MPFLNLPNELLIITASSLPLHDLSSLLRVNRRLASILTHTLHQSAALPRSVHRQQRAPVHCSLCWAAWKGYDGLFKLLLQKGFNIHCRHGSGHESLLHFAARGGSEAIVHLVLEKGDANMQGGGATPLHYAVLRGHEAVVRLLLEKGARVNAGPAILLWTLGYHAAAVARAAEPWNPEVFRLLLAHGACTEARDFTTGETALHQAVRFENLEMIEMLLEMGVSNSIRSRNGQTAFEWAMQWQAGKVVKWLQLEGLVPLLKGRYYDERPPQGSLEYWRLACGEGRRNRLRSLWKAFVEGDPMAGQSNQRRLKEHCRREDLMVVSFFGIRWRRRFSWLP